MGKGHDMATKSGTHTTSPDPYLKLIVRFPLRPLKNEDELSRAIAVIDSLIIRGDLDEGEQDYLEILTDIVEKYERDEHPMRRPSDAEMLRFLIEDRKITQSELAEATKIANSTISEILSGKRELTRSHVGVIAKYFGVRPTVFAFPT
jgi:HTH-type transcriptional regulator / antitoxin HigA